MVQFVQKYLGVAAVTFLTACTTLPSTNSAYPLATKLAVCSGTVSNAPRTDAQNYIRGYEPYTEISNIVIARAPVRSCLSSGFGPRSGGAGTFHNGIDLFTPHPEPIVAGGTGIVEALETKRGYGRTIIIRHSKRVKTLYGHLSSYARGLSVGDRVELGDVIGYTGDSGNATAIHLHYEIIASSKPKNPLTQ